MFDNSSFDWQPSSLQMYVATDVILNDHLPNSVDAIFIHGSPVREPELDKGLLSHVYDRWDRGFQRSPQLVINGIPAEVCEERHLAYPGAEPWLDYLASLGVKDVLKIAASSHTPAEVRNLCLLAETEGWEKVVITTYHVHLLRCAQTAVSILKEMASPLKIYFLAGPPIPLTKELHRQAMGGATVTGNLDTIGNLPVIAEQEYIRIIDYARKAPIKDGKPIYTQHATISEVFAYLYQREGL